MAIWLSGYVCGYVTMWLRGLVAMWLSGPLPLNIPTPTPAPEHALGDPLIHLVGLAMDV